MNIWDILLILLLAAALGWAVYRTLHRKSSCCADCRSCKGTCKK